MSILELSDISISSKDKILVRGVDLHLQSGELCIIVGANGSGKSSLINGIFGHPRFMLTSGRIMIDDEEVTQFVTEEKARKGLFLSMQHLPSISGVTLTNFLHRIASAVFGNTEEPIQFYEKLVVLAEQFGLDKGLLLREVNTGLSGGEKKQAELLQLIALRPKFAFLDEIDAGMDIDMERKLRVVLDYLRTEGMGIVLVSHHIHTLAEIVPDKVLIMRDGQIIEHGGAELIPRIVAHGFSGLVE